MYLYLVLRPFANIVKINTGIINDISRVLSPVMPPKPLNSGQCLRIFQKLNISPIVFLRKYDNSAFLFT